ncbi:MAG TPA: VOC family protein [Gaiellales bacterium]|jgi:catechol 2,3-dioxygenase-like lactoylglutathione lyase family enzyme
MSARVLHHVDIRVSDLAASRAFYETVLASLGFGVMSERPDPNGGGEVAFGADDGGEFAIHEPTPHPGQDTVTRGAHIAFQASDRAAVDGFHAAAAAAGARSIGEPGLRSAYADDYYGAFVLDPDGNNIEAVCHLDASGGG